MRNTQTSLFFATAMSVLAGMGTPADAVATLRSAGSGNNRRPTPPRMDTVLAREIAEHNDAVDRRKAEKKARKYGR